MNLKKMLSFTTLLTLLIACNSCGATSEVQQLETDSIQPETIESTAEETTEEPTTAPPPDKRVHVISAGDNLIHYSVFKNAEAYAYNNGEDVKYDFKPVYENVKPLIQSADVAIINQETVISPSNQVCGVIGTTLVFNSPPEVADDIIDAGFDVITMANNHLLDMGASGLEESINFWNEKAKENDLTVLGAYLNEEDANDIRIREVNGVKIAFLAYAEHINGFSIPSDSPLRVIMNYEEDVIEKQIKKADELADAVVVSVHWGVEDTHEVSDDRKELAQKMVDWGADVILGAHPHTPQTMEWLTRADGSKGFVYYSMGNFVCAQTDNFNLIGEMPDFDIVIDGATGETRLENVGAIPTIIHYDDGYFSNIRIYTYSQYSPELAESHGLPSAYPPGSCTWFDWDTVNDIVFNNIPEEFRKLDK